MEKKGTILVENVVFIILNLVFISILVLFLLRQGSNGGLLEQIYAKEIAMIADSAKPVMMIKLDMDKGGKIAEKNGINFNEIVKIEGNIVKVQLSENGGYSYAFFNDIDIKPYAETDEKNEYTGIYIFTINEKDEKT